MVGVCIRDHLNCVNCIMLVCRMSFRNSTVVTTFNANKRCANGITITPCSMHTAQSKYFIIRNAFNRIAIDVIVRQCVSVILFFALKDSFVLLSNTLSKLCKGLSFASFPCWLRFYSIWYSAQHHSDTTSGALIFTKAFFYWPAFDFHSVLHFSHKVFCFSKGVPTWKHT